MIPDIVSNEAAQILPLVTLDSKESSIEIAYPEYNTMKKTSVVTVCCVNTGKVIDTRRKSAGSSIETNGGHV